MTGVIDWNSVLNGSGFAFLAAVFLITGLSLWDRNGRRLVAAMWWGLAAVYSLVATSTIIVASTMSTNPLDRWLHKVQWTRTVLVGITVYLTVAMRKREARTVTLDALTLVEEYGNGRSVQAFTENRHR